jgi:hypothetical protein
MKYAYQQFVEDELRPLCTEFKKTKSGFDPVLGMAVFAVRRLASRDVNREELFDGLKRHFNLQQSKERNTAWN